MSDFWEFIAPKEGWMTVETLQAGYLKFRDPKYGGDKAVVFLRHLFEQCDADGSGELSKREFMTILKSPKNMEKLNALGMNVGGALCTNESEVEDALLLFFYELDVDFSGSLSVDEMIQGFVRCRDDSRMRQLENTGLATLENIAGEKAKPSAPYTKKQTRQTQKANPESSSPLGVLSMKSPTTPLTPPPRAVTSSRTMKSLRFKEEPAEKTLLRSSC